MGISSEQRNALDMDVAQVERASRDAVFKLSLAFPKALKLSKQRGWISEWKGGREDAGNRQQPFSIWKELMHLIAGLAASLITRKVRRLRRLYGLHHPKSQLLGFGDHASIYFQPPPFPSSAMSLQHSRLLQPSRTQCMHMSRLWTYTSRHFTVWPPI